MWFLLGSALMFVVLLAMACYVFMAYTGPDAERNFKRLIQGPFVPQDSGPSDREDQSTKK
jgi:hypothetical protein